MYTWEIKDYLKRKNYKLIDSEVKFILNSEFNPQICSIEWQDFSNGFYVTTKEIYNNVECYDGFFFEVINCDNIIDNLNSGVKKYLLERNYKLVSEEIFYLTFGKHPNTEIMHCKCKDGKYYLSLKINNNMKIDYYESYEFFAFEYMYTRLDGKIVVRECEEEKNKIILKKV